jgi:electron transport complex protein RnfC
MAGLFKFFGGVHPPEHKAQSTRLPIARPPLPPRLFVPLHQHIGNHAKPAVRVDEVVLRGQMIGEAQGRISVAVHAPCSGTVRGIAPALVPHPSGLSDLCIEIEPDHRDAAIEARPLDWRGVPRARVFEHLRQMGVAGLGGAVFPTYAKLAGAPRVLDTLVINGAECEPFITCDDLLMRERAAEIIAGALIMGELLPARRVVVGIEDNKPQALAAMDAAARQAGGAVVVVAVPTIYPGGGAKQLIRVLTGIEVPTGQRSTELGVQCFNVATASSVWRALVRGEALTHRIVTVTGNVREPRNYEAPLGTPIAHLLAQAGELPGTTGFIMGGPMMGFELPAAEVPVVKASNCVIAKSAALFPPPAPELPCIRCTRCVTACPAELTPHELYWFAKSRNFGKAQEYALFDCIECGACAYVCPSNIPLVSYFRFAKSEIWAREREKNAADEARERHEARAARLERDKQERAEKLAAKTAAAAPPPLLSPASSTRDTALVRTHSAAAAPVTPTRSPNEGASRADELETDRARLRELAEQKHEHG